MMNFAFNMMVGRGNGDGQRLSGQEACTDNVYEYMYSHNERPSGSTTSYENLEGAGSNVNIYIGCDSSGRVGTDGQPITNTAGYSTCGHDTGYRSAPGTVLRVNLLDSGSSLTRRATIPADYCAAGGINPARHVDARANWAMFDVSLHNAGSFDTLTTRWVHFALTVTPSKVAVYLDGIEQNQFCFFDPQPVPPPPPPGSTLNPFAPPPRKYTSNSYHNLIPRMSLTDCLSLQRRHSTSTDSRARPRLRRRRQRASRGWNAARHSAVLPQPRASTPSPPRRRRSMSR